MSHPTPKADALRAMREARFAANKPAKRAKADLEAATVQTGQKMAAKAAAKSRRKAAQRAKRP
jgi:hypothetical protein